MKHLIALFIVMLSFMASSFAGVTHPAYKMKSKISKGKINTLYKKSKPVSAPSCDTYTSQTGEGIIYICWSDLPCPAYHPACECSNLPLGGSVTIAIVYPE